MTAAKEAYDALIKHTKETALLASTGSVLGWDRETYMPPGGHAHRAEQLALISRLVHERSTDPRIGEWLAAAEGTELTEDPLAVSAVNLREIRRDYDKHVKVPPKLVEETARATSLGHAAWVEAREKDDFATFQPHLETIVRLRREYADAVGYDDNIYDALLDDYEPGAKTADVAQVFGALRPQLVELNQKIANAPKQPDRELLKGTFPIDRQRAMGEMCAAAYGFNFKAGRLDTVVHPFCMGIGPGDTRITTRWDESDFGSALFGILHETGHGLYDQNLPNEHTGTPMGEAVSLAIHESQSRMWENIVGRSRSFWQHFLPKAQGLFYRQLAGVKLDDFLHAINVVEPSLIRVEADEATYNLHIILRFEIEQAIVSGDLAVADIPGTWNEMFKKMLDLDVPNDREGCLQDVHWSFGGFGYFPTYALGNLCSAQFYRQAEQAVGPLDAHIAAGDFRPLLDWCKEHIYSQGKRYRAPDLVETVTGEPLSDQPLMDYLTRKYQALYGF